MLQTRIVPRVRDLGDGFQVRRALPTAECRSVGPFVFFDQMGPVELAPGHGLDVRPHPHIGLATVTYLFEGEIVHRDSLGTVQVIRPGEVNWMVAGRGVAHSERTAPELRARGTRLSGIQTWIALPVEHEEDEPSFAHHASLPVWEDNGVRVRLILGDWLDVSSPVATYAPTFYADVTIDSARGLTLPADRDERGVYVVDGTIEVDGTTHPAGEMLVFTMGSDVTIRSREGARLMAFGGAALDGPRHVWWNFVSSRKERIAQAAEDWKAGRFAAVPDEAEFIPLPDRAPGAVSYP